MATATGNYVADNSTLANFKSWAMAISAAFSAFGWTQTTDTGQVNWSTISAVPSSAYVYEVWKAADTQAATPPIFVKMEYGYSSTQVGIRVTVGTSSNGSGGITGAVSFNAAIVTNNGAVFANQGSTAYACYFSGDAGEFRMLLWSLNNTTLGVTTAFGIERSKDATGAKTTDYFTSLAASSASNMSANVRQQTTLTGGTVTSMELNFVTCSATTGSNTAAFGGTVAAFPVFPLIGKLGNPMLGWMNCVGSDVADGATVTVASMYGGTHTFIATKSAGLTSPGFSRRGLYTSNGLAGALLMRYE